MRVFLMFMFNVFRHMKQKCSALVPHSNEFAAWLKRLHFSSYKRGEVGVHPTSWLGECMVGMSTLKVYLIEKQIKAAAVLKEAFVSVVDAQLGLLDLVVAARIWSYAKPDLLAPDDT